jgi:hypothetical protein
MAHPDLMIGRRTALRGKSAKRLPPSLNGISRFHAPECAPWDKNYPQYS